MNSHQFRSRSLNIKETAPLLRSRSPTSVIPISFPESVNCRCDSSTSAAVESFKVNRLTGVSKSRFFMGSTTIYYGPEDECLM